MIHTSSDPGRPPPWPIDDEPEGAAVPDGVAVFDAHVHLFPERLFDAIWRWFDRHAWAIRYRLYAEDAVAFLRARGVRRMAGLCYSHKPGLAEVLNRYMAELGRAHPEIVPLATVLPGEPDAARIVKDAFDRLGLRGIKLHCHVQKMAADDERLDAIYRLAADAGRPIVLHAGREPSFPAYGVDTRELCAATQIERVLERHPRLVLIVPHLGMDEIPAYERLLRKFPNLWLDTTMAIGEFFTTPVPPSLFPGLAERLLYGTDFPNVPYAWDRELKTILGKDLPPAARHQLLWQNAATLFA